MAEEFKVTVGEQLKIDEVFEIRVDQDIDRPDMATVVCQNINGARSTKVKEGDPLKVEFAGKVLFDGEVTGIEPVFDHNMPSRVTVRGLTKMHRLTRGRKSRTFEKMTDQDIAQKVGSEAGLSVESDGAPKIKHDHVFQHNQTNLEFLLQRAKRIDFEVRCEGSKLFFKKRDTSDSGVKVEWGGGQPGSIERFRPKISGLSQVNKVTVRGWDPAKKKEIIGVAQASGELGGTQGASVAQQAFGMAETFETDRPVYTKEEADAVAKGILRERQMQYITGEALLLGNPAVKAGKVITMTVNDSKFNGKYYVTSCQHRYIHSVAGIEGVGHREAGYRTLVKIRKDSQG